MNCEDMIHIPELQGVMNLKAGKEGILHPIRWIYFADCLQCVKSEYRMEEYIHGGEFVVLTNLTMALTAKKVYAVGRGPFPSSIYRAPYPYLYRAPKGYTEEEAIQYYIEELNRIFDEGAPANEIACMIVESLQGEGGFIPAPIEWVKAVRKICDDNGILMIADEVQCGNCRTGKYYASEYWKEAGAAPDIIATAKSLGGGLPISAITARAEIIKNAMQKGLLLESCGTASNTIRFLAPLTMTDEQMEKGLEIFEEAIKESL